MIKINNYIIIYTYMYFKKKIYSRKFAQMS